MLFDFERKLLVFPVFENWIL